MRTFALFCCLFPVTMGGCKKDKEGSSSSTSVDDTGGEEVVLGVCQTPESGVGWYCAEYTGASWSEASAATDCGNNFPGGVWAVGELCDEGAVGNCEIEPGPGHELNVYLFGMDSDVAEADCEELLQGEWSD